MYVFAAPVDFSSENYYLNLTFGVLTSYYTMIFSFRAPLLKKLRPFSIDYVQKCTGSENLPRKIIFTIFVQQMAPVQQRKILRNTLVSGNYASN
jgi:hypothetical protein